MGAGTPAGEQQQDNPGGGQAQSGCAYGPGLAGLEFSSHARVLAQEGGQVLEEAGQVGTADGTGDAQGLDDAVSDRVGDCLFHPVQGEFEAPVSAVVARECFEGESYGGGSLVGEVAQDLGQGGPGTHAGDHGVDDLGPGGAHGLGATGHAGNDPRVGQEGDANGDDEGDRPGSRREQDGEGNNHAEAEADRDESHGIESGDAGARHIIGEALPRPPGRAFRWRGEPRGQGHDKADPEDKATHDGDHSAPQSSREARSKPAAAKRSCRSREPAPRSQRPPS